VFWKGFRTPVIFLNPFGEECFECQLFVELKMIQFKSFSKRQSLTFEFTAELTLTSQGCQTCFKKRI
jgi:hypothetical protein